MTNRLISFKAGLTAGRTAWYLDDMDTGALTSLAKIREIHHALLSLSDEDYAKVVELIEGEDELYE